MAEGMLPPLILELRARGAELFAELKKAQAEVKTTTEEAGSRASMMGDKIQAMGKGAALGLAGATVAVGVESLKMASDFQSHMTLLETAGGESKASMGAISDGVLGIARATGTSVDQLGEGMYTVAKAMAANGVSAADQLTVLKAAAQGARAENVDMATSVDALTSVIMTYGYKAKDAVSVQNMMIAGSGLAKTTMQEYAGALSTVLPTAQAAGVGFDQVAGAIATLTQHGTTARESTQELSNTIRNLMAPNAVAQKAMQQLGLSVNDVSQGLRDPNVGLQGTIMKITGAIKDHMGPAGLVVVDTFNKSASATKDLQTMIGKMPPQLASLSKGLLDGSVTVGQFTKASGEFGGQAGAMGKQFLGLYKNADGFNQMLRSGTTDQRTAAAALRDMMGGATGMRTAMMLSGDSAEYFANATKRVGEAGKQAGADVNGWAETQKTFNVEMARLKEGAETSAISLGTKLLPVASKFAEFLLNNKPVVIAFAGVIVGVLVAAAAVWFATLAVGTAKAIWSFGEMIVKGTIWAATQAASLTESAVLWTMYAAESVAAAASSAAETVAIAAMMAPAWIAEHAAMFATTIAGWVSTAAAATAAFIAENAAMLGIGVAIAALVAGVIWLVTHWGEAWSAIKKAAAAVWDWMKPFVDWCKSVWGGIVGGVQTALGKVADVWHAIWNGITSVFGKVVDFIKQHAALIVGAIFILMPPLGLIIAAVHFVWTHWQQIWSGIKQITAEVVGIVTAIFHTLVEAGLWFIKAEIQGLENIWHAIWGAIQTAVDAVWGFLKPIFHAIVEAGLWFIRREIQGLENIWHAIWDGIQAAVDTVWNGFLKPIFHAIVEAGLWFIRREIQGFENIWHAIWDGIKTAVKFVWDFLSPIFTAIGDAIETGIHAAIKGLGDAWDAIWGGIKNTVSTVWGFLKPIFDAIGGAIKTITGGVGGIGNAIGGGLTNVGHMLGFADGGPVPGPPGKAQLAVVHGGEFMLSRQMLAGQQEIPDNLLNSAKDANSYRPASGSAAAFEGATTATTRLGGAPTVIVNAQTNASPSQIASSVGWQLRRMAS